MIYHFALWIRHLYPKFNFIHYISFRIIASLLSSLSLSLYLGPWFIALSKTFFRSQAREYTPANHQAKNDMPTMGGLFIITTVIISTLLWTNLYNPQVWTVISCLIMFSGIGLLDDMQKIKTKKGISSLTKFSLQIGAAALTLLLWSYTGSLSTDICIPFFKNSMPDLGYFFFLWAGFILVGTSNAVNLTDGLDGLAIGSLIINFGTFCILTYLAGHQLLANYLYIPFTGTSELAIVSSSLVGASLGFLWYNTYPAQIFMGDVGSLGLGAVLALMALMSKQELLLPLTGGLFMAETLSVIVQVLSLRYLGKRMFKMAPIHHHFELIGWQESKITIRFSIITLVLCLIALMTLKIR